jgi:hypothetical protein
MPTHDARPMKSPSTEVILAEIPGASENERLAVVHRHDATGSRVELRQQTWGEGIGWFTQTTLPLAPQQLADLRAALGGTSVAAPRTLRAARTTPSHLRVVAESA